MSATEPRTVAEMVAEAKARKDHLLGRVADKPSREGSESMVLRVGSRAPNFVAEAYVRGEPEPRKIQLSGS